MIEGAIDVSRMVRVRVEFDDAFADGQDSGLGPVVDVEFMEDVPDVIFHGFLAEVQHLANDGRYSLSPLNFPKNTMKIFDPSLS